MRVIVCGGRNFDDWDVMRSTLDTIHQDTPIACLIHGNARGADALAHRWAQDRGVETDVYTADWALLGPSAGPIRNRRMLDSGKPNLVVAFPGGRGTADMVSKARMAGVKVKIIR